MQDFELFHYWRSSCSWRVRWALNLKKIPHKLTPVNLLEGEQKSEDYIKKNPSGYVPTLKIGSQFLTESMAIIEWLDESFKNYPLLPQDPMERYKVRKLYHTIASGTQPIQNLAVLQYYSDDQMQRKEFAQHWISKGLAVYERFISKEKKSVYSVGEHISMADLCLIPQVYNANRFEIDMKKYPLVKGIYDRCMATKECYDASPERHQPK